ncbi:MULTISPECIES: DUF5302 domain-containing protein [Streptomyces]|uniref:DUF5302 domain-containing protein n=1 Tax=Streptomyces ardesiacus TaxID=285564 RepID=A0ABW8HD85_9ACTN|nr:MULTISPECIES: DUF5302 domain-containing protein [Streptomyces]NEB60650.1 DUF5302 domain-containing protein [Streptomyces diastaticus]KOT96047.1 hypothetical protein ADK87_24960 [Streptomyces sp. NRRL F-4711]KOX26691.1 hypothetical protein ADL07_31475 [Streptomyces sp. NRRL F-4707]KOX46436.1 hypothetical protein ADL09_18440 [Streptomyces sp. NRRL F-7442]MCL7366521.1 DUF5302 domain-containing protein [Streptomyces ardesiacus]
MTEESSAQAGSEPAQEEGSALTPDADGQYDLKDKFRQALERKRGKQAEAAAQAAHADTAKIRGAHGPAASQRSFRRKSG